MSERYRIIVTDGSVIDDFGEISAEFDAFWTFGPKVQNVEFVITADSGFAESFESESKLPGVVIEEMDEYEQ